MVRLELLLELNYRVTGPAGADFVFNVQAARTPHQTIIKEQLTLAPPLHPEIATDPVNGMRILRLHVDAGPLTLLYEATLDLRHHRADPSMLQQVDVRRLPLDVLPFLYPSRYCQSDRLMNLAFREFGAVSAGYARVLAIQQWVQDHVAFRSNVSNSNTSAVDTLIDGVGVCRDMAHLMIALCRAMNIPARVATGTDYGAPPSLGPPDFHAYVEVYLSDRWYIVDPSGTGIPLGFMRFGTGRDAADVAFATIFGGVESGPPFIQVRAVEGPGLELPVLCRDAVSTAEA